MPAINFQKRFAPEVESLKKRQTIRKKRRDGRDPKTGDMLYLYTGQRTKSCRKLGQHLCKSAVPIYIYYQDIVVAGQRLNADEELALAQADGFESVADFRSFFLGQNEYEFNGCLIKW